MEDESTMEDELMMAMAELDEEKTLALAASRLQAGCSPLQIIESCRLGVEIVGKKYDKEQYYLSDLIMSEEILKGVMQIVEPLFPVDDSSKCISVVMGTIEGDIHDLGKNIILYLLRSVGCKVYDLGVDVAPEKFVKAVSETGATVVGISVLLSFCVSSIKKVVDLLQEAGLRDQVKVIIGGYPVSQKVKEFTGADYYANDVTRALAIYQQILDQKFD